jgi:hypothetical protein
MSERHKIAENVNDSKATRLPIAEEFGKYRFGRDALAHTFRYLYIAEELIASRSEHRPAADRARRRLRRRATRSAFS